VFSTRYSRFDAVVLTVLAGLVVAILATVALADFGEAGLRVAYLAPATGMTQNIWIADLTSLDSPEQVTFSSEGIFNFDISPDGRYVAFAEHDSNSDTTEIKMLDLRTGALRQLTNCVAEDADCKTPVWRPDGNMIAYDRAELNSALTSAGMSPIRVWLIDLATDPITTPAVRRFADSRLQSTLVGRRQPDCGLRQRQRRHPGIRFPGRFDQPDPQPLW
jgi:dipeptidyl aminopeptidase/acylaminoacyl peptidase